MDIEYQLGEGDMQVVIDRRAKPIRVIFDPRMTILQIRFVLIEKLSPAEYDDFMNSTLISMEYVVPPTYLHLVPEQDQVASLQ